MDTGTTKAWFMFHKNARPSFGSISTAANLESPQQTASTPTRLTLVAPGASAGSSGTPQSPSLSPLVEFVAIAAPRCSSFLAEAAVLVLVFALLDRFIAHGSIGRLWLLTAAALSLSLLAASIATDFTSRRWLRAH